MPDGEFLPPFDLTCVEQHIKESILKNYNRYLVHARFAHITQPQSVHIEQGRGKCQARNLCMRGCPFGGYFSANSSTLPWAEKTGNLTVRPFSVVHSIIFDKYKNKATGVRIIDANTKAITEYFAQIIFVNASALNSNLILLNSTSDRFPNGLGNDNGLLGKYVCFHNYRGWVNGTVEGYEDKYYYGRNPNGFYYCQLQEFA
jgi:choline dehydrogenase-like flavoprotein